MIRVHMRTLEVEVLQYVLACPCLPLLLREARGMLAKPLPNPSGYCRFSWGAILGVPQVILFFMQPVSCVNEGIIFVLASWDRDVPHQTHPQSPIHTSLARLGTV